jgi:hypothetical protein
MEPENFHTAIKALAQPRNSQTTQAPEYVAEPNKWRYTQQTFIPELLWGICIISIMHPPHCIHSQYVCRSGVGWITCTTQWQKHEAWVSQTWISLAAVIFCIVHTLTHTRVYTASPQAVRCGLGYAYCGVSRDQGQQVELVSTVVTADKAEFNLMTAIHSWSVLAGVCVAASLALCYVH